MPMWVTLTSKHKTQQLVAKFSSVHKTQVYGKIIRELEQLETVEQVFVNVASPPLQTKLARKLKQHIQYDNNGEKYECKYIHEVS